MSIRVQLLVIDEPQVRPSAEVNPKPDVGRDPVGDAAVLDEGLAGEVFVGGGAEAEPGQVGVKALIASWEAHGVEGVLSGYV